MIDPNQPQHFESNSIFWVDVDKIRPNPFQPRKEFDEARLRDLADSIRQYGVLMPLVVTRQEFQKDDGGLMAVYELIAGERRLRASKLAGIAQVPVVIRAATQTDKEKLEIAIIENLQREDLNPMDRARAFDQLHKQFGLTQVEIGKKIGKSREYVANSIRLLALPMDMQEALSAGKISEGHTRPLLMLIDRPQEQQTLFREIMLKKMTVREAERISRTIAYEKRRKFDEHPEIMELQERLTEKLGTRVFIDQKQVGGKVMIDYFSINDIQNLFDLISRAQPRPFKTQIEHEELTPPAERAEITSEPAREEIVAHATSEEIIAPPHNEEILPPHERTELPQATEPLELNAQPVHEVLPERAIDDRGKQEQDEDLYAVSNFSL